MTIKRLLYSGFLYLIFPIVILRLLYRSRKNPAYRKRLAERLGFYLARRGSPQATLWVHAVSVGEAIAAKPLVEALMIAHPNKTILMTTTTPTGSDRVRSMFASKIETKQLIHVYFPYDLLGVITRFLKRFSPIILIVVETEIWPNLYAKCHQQGIPVLMVNARLSEKSTQAYLKIKSLVRETLTNVNTIAVRSSIDEERFLQLGATPEQIEAIGNIKYDLEIDNYQVEQAKRHSQAWNKGLDTARLVLVAASTHAGEDELILACYRRLKIRFPSLLLIVVPRHPERFESVFQYCVNELMADVSQQKQSVIKHSQTQGEYGKLTTAMDVVIGDTMGEMQMWYATADAVFIGGSLVKTGGHNPLEATIFGVPVVSGPYMFNFEDISVELSQAELLTVAEDQSAVEAALSNLLLEKQSPSKANSYPEKAEAFLQQHRGVTARLVYWVSKLL